MILNFKRVFSKIKIDSAHDLKLKRALSKIKITKTNQL